MKNLGAGVSTVQEVALQGKCPLRAPRVVLLLPSRALQLETYNFLALMRNFYQIFFLNFEWIAFGNIII